jgi:hypothetical protein
MNLAGGRFGCNPKVIFTPRISDGLRTLLLLDHGFAFRYAARLERLGCLVATQHNLPDGPSIYPFPSGKSNPKAVIR